jgi:uncharacterized membrane protein YphA (DoxX/SURF4 family)
MHTHIASPAQTHRASTAVPAGFRTRLATVTAFLQRLPLPLLQLFADEYQVPILSPEIAAMMSVTFEFGCSILLVLGLATRLATLPLLGMLAVIQTFVYPNAWSDHLTWGSILLFLLTRGGGVLSLDWLLGLEPANLRQE